MTQTISQPETNGPPNTGDAGDMQHTHKYLSFCLGSEEYGLEILSVREIIGIIDITPLPQTPKYVKGVINLRGKIIPVIELRTKFGLDACGDGGQTCVIVVEVDDPGSGEAFEIGIIVDSVREVLDIVRDMIDPPPTFGCSVPMQYITGIGKVKDKVVVLLNITQVVTTADLERMQNAINPSDSNRGATAGA
jgi:purine-binding chemotaxis protein CheW